MIEHKKNQDYSAYLNGWTKRLFDIFVCSLLLVPAVVIMGLAIFYILIAEGRPVFFIHRRVGKDGRIFRMPKLRTLRTNAEPYVPSAKSDYASLVTQTGDFLRRHRLDELPQLISVLTGRMSLVGPRPELPNVAATYKPVHKTRLLAKPGITGLWQLLGNHKLGMRQDMFYDIYYLSQASLWLDMRILLMTVLFVLEPK